MGAKTDETHELEIAPKLGVEREKGRSGLFKSENPVFQADENAPGRAKAAGRGKAGGAFVSSRCSGNGTRGICD